jgi:broad specificity polyphosphatase/5'/3'-nucleotidase SurE
MLGAEGPGEAVARRRPESMIAVGGDTRNPVFELDGSPTDCVHIALGSDLVGDIDVVIAGVGVQGTDTLVLDAAREAAMMGRQGLALAIDISADTDFSWCGLVVAELAAWVIASPPPVRCVLAISVPAQLTGRGIQLLSTDKEASAAAGHIAARLISIDPTAELSGERLSAWAEKTVEAINPRLGVTGGICLAGCCG